MEGEYICIKAFKGVGGVAEVGKKYLLISSDIYKEIYIILGVVEIGILKSMVFKYFITLAEWRDKQIDSILND